MMQWLQCFALVVVVYGKIGTRGPREAVPFYAATSAFIGDIAEPT